MSLIDFSINANIQFLSVLIILAVLIYAGRFLFNKVKNISFVQKSKLLNPTEYLPEEEVTTMKQVFYLIMIVIFVVNIVYVVVSRRATSNNLLILDILVSLYLLINGDIEFREKKLLFVLLLPIASIFYLLYGENQYMEVLDILHAFAFPYFIKLYYEKFIEYTETNSLGITIMLLFLVVFVSFIFTMLSEHKYPLDALVMVSNAFTSNGYSVLGTSTFGKINSLVLVWGGYILSGVGTATLAFSIVKRHNDRKFDRLEELVKKNKKK